MPSRVEACHMIAPFPVSNAWSKAQVNVTLGAEADTQGTMEAETRHNFLMTMANTASDDGQQGEEPKDCSSTDD
jgi:hypothetical protein